MQRFFDAILMVVPNMSIWAATTYLICCLSHHLTGFNLMMCSVHVSMTLWPVTLQPRRLQGKAVQVIHLNVVIPVDADVAAKNC